MEMYLDPSARHTNDVLTYQHVFSLAWTWITKHPNIQTAMIGTLRNRYLSMTSTTFCP